MLERAQIGFLFRSAHTLVLTLLLIASSYSHSQLIRGEEPRITEYGIYKRVGEATYGSHPSPEVSHTPFTTNSETELVRIGTSAPGELGSTFEYCFAIPANGNSLTLTKQFQHPAIQKPGGEISTGYAYDYEEEVVDGEAQGCINFGFDYEWEIAIGVWTLSILHQGQPLLSQSFVIYTPFEQLEPPY